MSNNAIALAALMNGEASFQQIVALATAEAQVARPCPEMADALTRALPAAWGAVDYRYPAMQGFEAKDQGSGPTIWRKVISPELECLVTSDDGDWPSHEYPVVIGFYRVSDGVYTDDTACFLLTEDRESGQ